MNQTEKRIMVVTCFGHYLSHFNVMVFPAVLLPLVERLGLPMAQVLGLSFLMYLFFGVSALPWGFLGDRFGIKRLMLLYFLGAGCSGVGAGFVLDSPFLLAVCLTGIGLFSGIYHPLGLGLISKGVRRVDLGLGINGIFGNLGLATAPLMAGVVNWLAGPRAVLWFLGGLNLAGAVLMSFLQVVESKAGSGKIEAGGSREDGRLVRAFFILIGAAMIAGFTYRGASVILPTFLELKGQGVFQALAGVFPGELSPNLVATLQMSLIYLSGMLGQYIGGRVGERFDPPRAYLVYNFLTLGPVFLLGYFSDLPMVLLALVYMFILLGMQPLENTLIARLTPRRFRHAAYGAKFTMTFGVGSLSVKAVGAIQAGQGIEAVFPFLGMVTLGMVGMVGILVWQTRGLELNQ